MNIVFYDQKGNPISFDDRLDSVKSVEKLLWYVNLAYVPEITEPEDKDSYQEYQETAPITGMVLYGQGSDPYTLTEHETEVLTDVFADLSQPRAR